MAISGFTRSASVSISQNSKIITVTGSVDCSHVVSGTAILIDGLSFLLEGSSGTNFDSSGNSIITLSVAHTGANIVAKPMVMYNTLEGLRDAVRKARTAGEDAIAVQSSFGDLLLGTTETVDISINGVTTALTPYQYMANLLQTKLDDADVKLAALAAGITSLGTLEEDIATAQTDINSITSTLEAHKTAAASSETNAAASGITSQAWAESDSSPVEVGAPVGSKSSKTHAGEAKASSAASALDAITTTADATTTTADVIATAASAASAAASTALALTYKNQAQSAAGSVTGQMFYAGSFDASAGVPTTPTSGSSVYIISVAGTINSIAFEVDDLVFYDNITDTGTTSWRRLSSAASGSLSVLDYRTTARTPENWEDRSVQPFFTDTLSSSVNGTYASGLHISGEDTVTHQSWQIFSGSSENTADDTLYFRSGKGTSWNTVQEVLTDQTGASLTTANTFTGGTQTFNSANQLIEVDSARARLHVGVNASGVGGTVGAMIYDGEGGTTLSHGMYIGYDCYMDPNTDLWAANRTTTSNKWVQTMGSHTNAVNFYRFNGDVAQAWKTSDMDLMFAIENDKVYCGASIEAPAFVSKETDSTHILSPAGGSSRFDGTGAIQVKLPISNSNTMLTVVVEVYDFGLKQSFDVKVSGYSHTTDWKNGNISVVGGSNLSNRNVRVGRNSDSDMCIWIGDLDSVWNNCTVKVKSVTASYGNFTTGWDSGWGISVQSIAFTNVYIDNLSGESIERIGSLGFKGGVVLDDYNTTSLKLESNQSTTSLRVHTSAGYQGGLLATDSTGFGLVDDNNTWAVRVETGAATSLYVSNAKRIVAGTSGVAVNGDLTIQNTSGLYTHTLGVTSNKDSFYKSSDSVENKMFWKDGADNTIGSVYGTGSNFGLLDSDGSWAVRVNNNVATYLLVNNQKRLVADTLGAYCRGRFQVDSEDGTAGHTFSNDGAAASTMDIKSASNTENKVKFYTGNGAHSGSIYGTSGSTFGLLDSDGNWGFKINTDTDTSLYVNNVKRLSATTSGATVNGELIIKGDTTNHLKLYSTDDTYLGSIVGTGTQVGILGGGGDWGVRVNKDDSAELLHNGAVKLETKTDGVDVTGDLGVTGDLVVGTTDILTELAEIRALAIIGL